MQTLDVETARQMGCMVNPLSLALARNIMAGSSSAVNLSKPAMNVGINPLSISEAAILSGVGLAMEIERLVRTHQQLFPNTSPVFGLPSPTSHLPSIPNFSASLLDSSTLVRPDMSAELAWAGLMHACARAAETPTSAPTCKPAVPIAVANGTGNSPETSSCVDDDDKSKDTNRIKIFCRVDSCGAMLSGGYFRRYHVCAEHSKAEFCRVGGCVQRFCQLCSRFHEITEFDIGKRSCRARLDKHNSRRRRYRLAKALNMELPIETVPSSRSPGKDTPTSSNSTREATPPSTRMEL